MSFLPGVVSGVTPRSLVDAQFFVPRAPASNLHRAANTYAWDEFEYAVPPWARVLYIRCYGAGGGGGGGRQSAAGTAAWGGGGGGAGSVGELWVPAQLIPSRLWLLVGWGGAGGAGVSTISTSGGVGLSGKGSWVLPPEGMSNVPDDETQMTGRMFIAGRGGSGGGGGTNAAAGAGTAGATTVWAGAAGGNSAAGVGVNGVAAVWTAGGGGGGGQAATHTTGNAGGTGAWPTSMARTTAPAAGASGGGTGANGSAFALLGGTNNRTIFNEAEWPFPAQFGGSGSGGGSNQAGAGGNGGNGAIGCGGGGGGAKEDAAGVFSGSGGNGGPGAIIIVAFG